MQMDYQTETFLILVALPVAIFGAFGASVAALLWLVGKLCPPPERRNLNLSDDDIYDSVERGSTKTETTLTFTESDLLTFDDQLAFGGGASEVPMTHGTMFHLPYIRDFGPPSFQAMILRKIIQGLGCHVYREVYGGGISIYTTYPWKRYTALK